MHGRESASASGVESDECYDAVDWKSILEEKVQSCQRSRINHLEKLLRKQEQRVEARYV